MTLRLNIICGKALFLACGAILTFFLMSPRSAWSAGAVPGDFQTILNHRSNALTIWNYTGNQNIYVFDFPGLILQGRTFNRLTQMTEQVQTGAGYPRVLNNEELLAHIEAIRRTHANFAFGHDALVFELVQFYNLADRDKIELFPEELVLRDFLLENGFIKSWRGFYQALQPDVVILSIPQVQNKKADEPQVSELAREAIFTHEISHAEYYTNPHFANYCRAFWSKTLTDAQRQLFLKFLTNYNYAVDHGEMIVNEMQAYLMFTPDPLSFSAKRLGVTEEELEEMREAFRKGKPPTRLPLQ